MEDLSQNQQFENQIQEVDYFDLLPDPILALIFNKLFDGKSLCSCLLVSKRCASLVSEVDSITIKMNGVMEKKLTSGYPKPKKPTEDKISSSSSSSKSFLKNNILKFICKPVYLLQQAIAMKKLNSSKNNNNNDNGVVDVMKWVGSTLKNFKEIGSLKLELPCHGGEIGINKNIPLLKWEAEFGKEMEKCAILGAASICDLKVKKESKIIDRGEQDGSGENEVQVFSDEELKLRIIWIISCLIASSARHNLMKKLVNQCPKLKNAVISDAGKQGKLSMNEEQLKELKESIKTVDTDGKIEAAGSELESGLSAEVGVDEAAATTTAASMGYAGNLVMKLWYVKELELPNSGKVMKGATLVVIKPERKDGGQKKDEGDGLNMWKAFAGEPVFEEAAKELLRRKEKRMYRLEMNSF